MNEPVPPYEVEFWRDHYVNGTRLGSTVIATGAEHPCGLVVVPRMVRGKRAVTLWLNVCDAADDLGADHINYRNPLPMASARKALAPRPPTP